MRHVFSSAWDVAHLWAHQLQDDARCSTTAMYFDGDTIYSYGSHFPIAKVIKNQRGEQAYLINSDTYSPSTSKHQNVVAGAIPSDSNQFSVSGCIAPEMIDELGRKWRGYAQAIGFIVYKLDDIVDLVGKHKRARFRNYSSEIVGAVGEIYRWIKFWDLNKPHKWYNGLKCIERYHYEYVYKTRPTATKFFQNSRNWQPFFDEFRLEWGYERFSKCVTLFNYLEQLGVINNGIGAYYSTLTDMLVGFLYGAGGEVMTEMSEKKLENAYKRKHAKELAEKKKEHEREYKHELEQLEKWHNGEIDSLSLYANKDINGWDAALRVKGDKIQTSKHIALSFEEGKRLWTVVKGFENGHKFQHELALDLNGQRWKFNKYEHHILTAGCHTIPFSECQRIANQMGW